MKHLYQSIDVNENFVCFIEATKSRGLSAEESFLDLFKKEIIK